MDKRDQHISEDTLAEMLVNEIVSDDIEAHFQKCSTCRQEWTYWQEIGIAVKQLPVPELSTDVFAVVERAIDDSERQSKRLAAQLRASTSEMTVQNSSLRASMRNQPYLGYAVLVLGAIALTWGGSFYVDLIGISGLDGFSRLEKSGLMMLMLGLCIGAVLFPFLMHQDLKLRKLHGKAF